MSFEIPIVKNQVTTIPKELIPYEKKHRVKDKQNYFIHFYIYDEKFIKFVNDPEKFLYQIKDFAGVISPDCSLYWDMPLATQISNTYNNRATAYYLQKQGIPVIPNIRWGDERTFQFAFSGVEPYGVYAISTYGCVKSKEERSMFKLGLEELIKRLSPKKLLVHGSMPDDIFGDFPSDLFVNYETWIARVYGKKDASDGN